MRAIEPGHLLAEFRVRSKQKHWSTRSPDTLLAPVWSPLEFAARLESGIVHLFRAHLRILAALQGASPPTGRAAEYARLYRSIQRYYLDWPILGAGEPVDIGALLAMRGTRWLFGRPDIVIAADGPRVVETNFDTAVGGYEKADDQWQVSARLFEPGLEYLQTGRPIGGLRDYFSEFTGGQAGIFHWIMVNEEGIKAEHADLLTELDDNPEGIQHRIHYAGEPVPAPEAGIPAYLHRSCTIYSVNRDRERFSATLRALAPQVRECTVPIVLAPLLSKMFLAWLSDPEARPALEDEERAAVASLVPWTRLVKLLDGDERGRVERDRGDFVLKKTDSHQAKDVFFGCNLAAEEWAALLAAKRQAPDVVDGTANVWIVQERVRPLEFHLIEYTDRGPIERRTGLSCCPYVLGGRLRALETWVTPATPRLDMIHRMQYVAHFLRS